MQQDSLPWDHLQVVSQHLRHLIRFNLNLTVSSIPGMAIDQNLVTVTISNGLIEQNFRAIHLIRIGQLV